MNVKKRIKPWLSKCIVATLLIAITIPSVTGNGQGKEETHYSYAKNNEGRCKYLSFVSYMSLLGPMLQLKCKENPVEQPVVNKVESYGTVTEIYRRPDIIPSPPPQAPDHRDESTNKDLSNNKHNPKPEINKQPPIIIPFPPSSRLVSQLWNNSIIASIAHAIMIPHFPFLAHEHGWDGSNYQIQDSNGIRGSITFQGNRLVGAFRNDNVPPHPIGIKSFFENAPADIRQIANQETLPYLLEDTNGTVQPSFQAAFWATDDVIHFSGTWDDLEKHGVNFFFAKIMEIEKAYTHWQDVYEMNDAQFQLLKSLSERKMSRPQEPIVLTQAEIKAIGTPVNPIKDGMDLCKASFQEIGIQFP